MDPPPHAAVGPLERVRHAARLAHPRRAPWAFRPRRPRAGLRLALARRGRGSAVTAVCSPRLGVHAWAPPGLLSGRHRQPPRRLPPAHARRLARPESMSASRPHPPLVRRLTHHAPQGLHVRLVAPTEPPRHVPRGQSVPEGRVDRGAGRPCVCHAGLRMAMRIVPTRAVARRPRPWRLIARTGSVLAGQRPWSAGSSRKARGAHAGW
jgi:hypothetical protein